MTVISPLLNILINSVRMVRKFVVRDFHEIEKIQDSLKSNEVFIKKSYSRLNLEVLELLQKIKPNFKIYNKFDRNNSDCWVIDFTDYEANLSRANENLGFGIALQENCTIKSFLFYNPIKDEYFFFEKGLGSYKNDSRIRVSNKKNKKEIIFSVYKKPTDDDIDAIKFVKEIFTENKISQREYGSIYTHICEVACGKSEGCVFVNPSPKLETICDLIKFESGGRITKIINNDSTIIVYSNKLIEKTVKEMLENNIIKL